LTERDFPRSPEYRCLAPIADRQEMSRFGLNPPRTKNKPHRVTRPPPAKGRARNRIPIDLDERPSDEPLNSPGKRPLPRGHLVIEGTCSAQAHPASPVPGADSYLHPDGPGTRQIRVSRGAEHPRCSDGAGRGKKEAITSGRRSWRSAAVLLWRRVSAAFLFLPPGRGKNNVCPGTFSQSAVGPGDRDAFF